MWPPPANRAAVALAAVSVCAAIAGADLVACPGCYPTAILLGFMPLLQAGIVDTERLIADAKTGVSGAGKSLNL